MDGLVAEAVEAFRKVLAEELTYLKKEINIDIERCCHGSHDPKRRSLGLAITAVYGIRIQTMKLPEVVMYDVEKVELSCSPTKSDGTPDDLATVEWKSSDPSQVGIEEIPDSNNRRIFATTPLEEGAAEVSCAAKGYETAIVPIKYLPFVEGQLNVSVGTPISDEPAPGTGSPTPTPHKK